MKGFCTANEATNGVKRTTYRMGKKLQLLLRGLLFRIHKELKKSDLQKNTKNPIKRLINEMDTSQKKAKNDPVHTTYKLSHS